MQELQRADPKAAELSKSFGQILINVKLDSQDPSFKFFAFVVLAHKKNISFV